MPVISAVLANKAGLGPDIANNSLRLLRSIMANFSGAFETRERLNASTLCAVFKAFFATINSSDMPVKDLGLAKKGEMNVEGALSLVSDLLPGLEGGACCFERVAIDQGSNGRKFYRGAFYLKEGPFNVACLVKFAVKGSIMVALLYDLHSNQSYKFKLSLANPKKVLIEKLSASLAKFRNCLPSILSLVSPARA